MKVDKITTTPIEIELEGATLLSVEEAHLLTKAERVYDNSWWLLQPLRDGNFFPTIINCYGSFRIQNHTKIENYCVRPALIIKNHNLQIGDKFFIYNYAFKVIRKNLAWLYMQDIGKIHFRDFYENSDVKKFVDEWFKELVNNMELDEDGYYDELEQEGIKK